MDCAFLAAQKKAFSLMNKIRKRKLIAFCLISFGLTLAFSLIIFSLRHNLNVFVTPSELLAKKENYHSFKLGGMVKEKSVKRDESGITFLITDFKKDIVVQYHGILPDLFREGKGVLVQGRLTEQGVFLADNVLAKHDENYMPASLYLAKRNTK